MKLLLVLLALSFPSARAEDTPENALRTRTRIFQILQMRSFIIREHEAIDFPAAKGPVSFPISLPSSFANSSLGLFPAQAVFPFPSYVSADVRRDREAAAEARYREQVPKINQRLLALRQDFLKTHPDLSTQDKELLLAATAPFDQKRPHRELTFQLPLVNTVQTKPFAAGDNGAGPGNPATPLKASPSP